jgi:hypothetical protein
MRFALCVSPSSLDRLTSHTDPEGCAGGAPNIPDRGGVLEGGACPLLTLLRGQDDQLQDAIEAAVTALRA